MRVEVRLDSFVLRVRVLCAESEGGVSIELITFTLLSESQWLYEAYQLN